MISGYKIRPGNSWLKLFLRIAVLALVICWLGSYNHIGLYLWKNWQLNQSSEALRVKTPVWRSYAGRFYPRYELTRIVRDFENDPTLPVAITDPSKFNGQYYSTYWLTAGCYEYQIAPGDGYIGMRTVGGNTKRLPLLKPAVEFQMIAELSAMARNSPEKFITPVVAARIALSFVRTRGPHSSDQQWRLSNWPRLEPPSQSAENRIVLRYSVWLTPYTTDGVKGPGWCSIKLDAMTGEVVNYMVSYDPIQISTIPSISSQYAMAAAMKGILIGDGKPGLVRGLVVAHPFGRGKQLLVWDVTFTGEGIGASDKHWAQVEAHTGVIVNWDPENPF